MTFVIYPVLSINTNLFLVLIFLTFNALYVNFFFVLKSRFFMISIPIQKKKALYSFSTQSIVYTKEGNHTNHLVFYSIRFKISHKPKKNTAYRF